MNLRKTQKLLWRLITQSAETKNSLRQREIQKLLIGGNDRLTAEEKIQIYAGMYFARILSSLRKDFPAVEKLLGSEGFEKLIADYLGRYPSRHWSLRYVGAQLPRYLSRHRLSDRFPSLPELARFELEILKAFDALDAVCLADHRLRRIPTERWGKIVLKTVPSLDLGEWRWPVDLLREKLLDGKSPRFGKPRPIRLVIWRKGYKVFYRRVDANEWPLLRSVSEGICLGNLVSRLVARLDSQRGVSEMNRYLKRWVREKLLAAPS